MNKTMMILSLAAGLGGGLLTGPSAVYAASPLVLQQDNPQALPPISLDLRDAPIRQALEQLFTSAKVDFSIDPSVAGFVSLRITEQPFENALRLILRSATSPLTYTRESGVYIVKPRAAFDPNAALAAAPPPVLNPNENQRPPFIAEQIQLTYLDPFDLQGVLGVQLLMRDLRGAQQTGGGGGGLGGGGLGGGGLGGLGGGGLGGLGGGGLGGGLGGGGLGGGLGGGGFGGGGLGGGGLGGGGFGGGGFGGGRGF